MKKMMLASAALLCLACFSLTGCGGSTETTVVEPTEETGSSPISDSQMEEYKKQMQGGRPGN